MRKRSHSNEKIDTVEYYWKRRPSEIRGYNRTIYTTTDDNNEYIRVDYNLKEKRIRLYFEDSEEGGNPYYSIITDGKITVERNATSGRVYNLNEKLSKRAHIFFSISNKDVIKLINKNYGIGIKGNWIPDREEIGRKREQRKIEIEEVKKRYFGSEQDNAIPLTREEGKTKETRKSNRFNFIDIIDIIIGIILCILLFTFNHNFVTLGVLAGFIGIFIGLVDVYYRERKIKLIKMLLFLLGGVIFYIYGYYIL